MVIAVRTLKLRQETGDVDIPIRMFAPEQDGNSWACRFEINWPDGRHAMAAYGVDAVQALELALRMIGALVYTSDYHASDTLMWEEPGKGYGFPVANTIRDLLEGDDKQFF